MVHQSAPATRTYLVVTIALIVSTMAMSRSVSTATLIGDDSACRLKSVPPVDVDFDEKGLLDADRQAFNDFSWRDLVALCWPAQDSKRGDADTEKMFGDKKTPLVVWTSWKSLDELYSVDQSGNPAPWQAFDASLTSPPDEKVGNAPVEKVETTKTAPSDLGKPVAPVVRLRSVNQSAFAASRGSPLIAQNGTFVRYEVRVNQVAYDFITKNGYYLKNNLPSVKGTDPLSFPSGSLIVKAAWMELTPLESWERFYHLPAEILEYGKDRNVTRRKATVGLVGLHIAHRTATRPSWIWSTFEQVDNIEPSPCATQASFSRDDPTTPNDRGYDYQPGSLPSKTMLPLNPKPVDVLRLNRIHSTTQRVNRRYHLLQQVRGTVWQNYRLVATQWVPKPDPGETAGEKLKTLPENGVTNPIIETYFQNSSCIRCHAFAPGVQTDFRFVFFPSLRAR